MPIARRLHHRPINPGWAPVSHRSQFAASGGPARFEREAFVDEHEEEAYDPQAHDRRERRLLVLRDRRAAALLGALGGVLGGAGMLFVARAMMLHRGAPVDPSAALGEPLAVRLSVAPQFVGFALAALSGLVVGGMLGRFTFRVMRVVPRVLFFSILIPAVWLCAQVFIVGHASRAIVAALPFAPFLVGSLVFALCVAIVPAARPVRIIEILPEKK